MKKILLFASLFAFGATTAQEVTETTTITKTRDNSVTVSAFGAFPEMNQLGVSIEFLGAKKETTSTVHKNITLFESNIFQVAYGMMNYEVEGEDSDGHGFTIDLGSRHYWGAENNGFYTSSFLSYGNIKFEETFVGGKVDGTYSYISLLNPEIGYKINMGNFSIDPFAGIMWKIEIKGKGFIDNRHVDEWTPRVGIRAGYQF